MTVNSGLALLYLAIMDVEQFALEEGELAPPRTTPPPTEGVRFHKRGLIEEVTQISRINMYDPEEIIAKLENVGDDCYL